MGCAFVESRGNSFLIFSSPSFVKKMKMTRKSARTDVLCIITTTLVESTILRWNQQIWRMSRNKDHPIQLTSLEISSAFVESGWIRLNYLSLKLVKRCELYLAKNYGQVIPWMGFIYALFLPCKEMVKEGFQLCTGLKCKRRCGMDEAVCEPEFRRACLCNRENIVIDEHLWSRMPSAREIKCQEACNSHNLGK